MMEETLPMYVSAPYLFKVSAKMPNAPLPESGLIKTRGTTSGGNPIIFTAG